MSARQRDTGNEDRRSGSADVGSKDLSNLLAYLLRVMNGEDDIPNFKDGVNANMSPSAAGITGGDGVSGYRMDAQGLTFWFAGVDTIALRPDTGSAMFKGDLTGSRFQTANSGNRVVIDGTSNVDQAQFYSGLGGELVPGVLQITTFNPLLASKQASLNLQSPRLNSAQASVVNLKSAPANGTKSSVTVTGGDIVFDTAPYSGGTWSVQMGHGNFTLFESDGATANMLYTMSSSVTVKALRSSSELQVRNGNDSAYATITADTFNKAGKTTITGLLPTAGTNATADVLRQVLVALVDAGLIASTVV